ncbi:MAG TPA: Cache 3/Cache 2 fusion domain-containing protein [Ktedonobacterales bacterium]|nr:Cache 3/Cache 2 fusion domain-containing protein [Ktedonobacterales bacterium]
MESSNSGYSDDARQSTSLPLARRASSGVHEGASPAVQRHAFRRLQTRQHQLPLLIATITVTLLVVIVAGYVAARANAISVAGANARTNVQIAREVIAGRGQYPSIVNNQLVAASGKNNYALVNDTWVVDHVRQLTGNLAVIYQLSGERTPSLRAVSTNVPRTDSQGHPVGNTRAIGQPMPPNAQAAIFGTCDPTNASAACSGNFSGEVTIAGVGYVAGFEPLLDQSGRLVGAVGVLQPLDDVVTGPLQQAIMLLLIGLLFGLIALMTGLWLAERFPNRLLYQLDSQLDTMAHAAIELGRLAHQQQRRLQLQQRVARQVGDHALKLELLASEMDDGQTALHQTTTMIWEAMSQPSVAINTATALRLAREAAVRASEVGTAGEATRAHAQQVITLMNRVIAEGRALAREGQHAESHANELAATLDRMETDLGERLVARGYDFGIASMPLIRGISGVSHRLRQMFQSEDQHPTNPPPRAMNRSPDRAGGPIGGVYGNRPGSPSLDNQGYSPPASFRHNPPRGGFPGRSQPGFQPPANPDVSGSRHGGRGGRRQAGDSPPSGLPPLGRFDDEPPYGSDDSPWLND